MRIFTVASVASVLFAFVACGGDEPVTAQLGGIPCVNPTANGFTAKSGLARKK